MNKEQVSNLFLDLLEGSLPEELEEEVLRQIAQNPEIAKLYKQYRTIAQLELSIGAETPQLEEDLSDSILNAINDGATPNIESLEAPAAWIAKTRWIIGSLSSVVVVLLLALVALIAQNPQGAAQRVVTITQNYTDLAVEPKMSPSPSSSHPSLKHVGFDNKPEALSLVAVELGEAPDLYVLTNPRNYVDIHIRYKHGETYKQHLIAGLVKVHSIVVRQTSDGNSTSVVANLLIPQESIKLLQIARVMGEGLQLNVVTPTPAPRQGSTPAPLLDPDGRLVSPNANSNLLAVLYKPDPVSGKTTRKVFKQGKWETSSGVTLTAF